MASTTDCTAAAPADAADAATKPPPRDLTHLYAEATKLRVASMMKQYYKFFQIPGIGNIAGGLPNVSFFPFDTLEAKIAKPERWTPSPNDPGGGEGAVAGSGAGAGAGAGAVAGRRTGKADPAAPGHLVVPKIGPPGVAVNKTIDLATALQYGTSAGYPSLLDWVRTFTREHLHPDVPYRGGPDVALTVGSTDGLAKTLELFVDNWNPVRDPPHTRPGLLCEPFIYGNVLSQIAPKGMHVAPVAADAAGMVAYGPGGLEDVLAHWDVAKGRRPHILYTVTMGHNPTGIVLSLERRKQLYAVCSRFDVIIAEDDPYWYLQYPSAAGNEAASRHWAHPRMPLEPPSAAEGAEGAGADAGRRSSGFAFLDSLVPSFLRIDVDGRVVRLDTFSKTVAPGCRLGWITAQPALIERFVRIAETDTQQPSGFVQAMIAELVMGPRPESSDGATTTSSKSEPAFAGWHVGGWVRWLEGLRGMYERRMDRMCTILDAGCFQLKQGTPLRPADADWGVITKTQLYSFAWPRGGMFVWIRMHFETHPLWMAEREREPRPDVGVAADDSDESDVLDGPLFAMALLAFVASKPHLVAISPGLMFSADDAVRRSCGWAHFRLCFAAESEENIDACSHRLVAAIHKFWKVKKVADFEQILRDSPMHDTAAAAAADDDDDVPMGNLSAWLGC